jgi:hypothetical protein
MMRPLTLSLSLLLVAGLATTGWLVSRPLATVTLPEPQGRPTPPGVRDAPRAAVDSLVAHVVHRDVFRLARRPAAVAYDPQALAQPEPPPPLRPPLRLVGIVWDGGLDPTALLEGLPGVEGPRAVRRGERVGELRVRTIAAQHVVILGPDTVWTLTVREPWRDGP